MQYLENVVSRNKDSEFCSLVLLNNILNEDREIA
jgi:hypothetical protein